MEFRLFSDMHNEFFDPFLQYTPPYIPGDENRVLVLAGDIHCLQYGKEFTESLTKMAKQFKAIVYVPGNHEFYSSRIDKIGAKKRFDTKMNPDGLDNVHFLMRDSVVIDGIRFVGATLWTNMDKANPIVEFHLKELMNDFKRIDYYDDRWDSYHSFKPKHWLNEHVSDLNYIKSTVDASEEPCVVVTHHAPSAGSLDPRFENDLWGRFGYHSVLDEVILDRPKIKFWCHGHIHKPSDYMVGDTNVLCNPCGYHNEQVEFFDKVIHHA